MTDFTEFPIPTKTFDPAQFAGEDGREVEIQASDTHIQWRYVGTATWTDLIALSELEGAQGPAGADGTDGREVELQANATHIQWRYVGDVAWVDLVALADLMPANAVTSQQVSTIAVVDEGAIPDPADPDTLYIELPV